MRQRVNIDEAQVQKMRADIEKMKKEKTNFLDERLNLNIV